MLFQTCTKLTFSLSDEFVVTVIARNRINGSFKSAEKTASVYVCSRRIVALNVQMARVAEPAHSFAAVFPKS